MLRVTAYRTTHYVTAKIELHNTLEEACEAAPGWYLGPDAGPERGKPWRVFASQQAYEAGALRIGLIELVELQN